MANDVQTRVAEAECPHCDGTGGELLSVCCGAQQLGDVEGMCSDCRDWTGFSRCEECGESGLHWPTLSRTCSGCHPGCKVGHTICGYFENHIPGRDCKECDNTQEIECFKCGGLARVPDVTLDKVLALLEQAYPNHTLYYEYNMSWDDDYTIGVWYGQCNTILGTEPTLLDAACAALLASIGVDN